MLKKLRSPLGYLLVSGLLLVVGLAGLFVLALRQTGDPYIGEVVLADGVHRLRLYQTTEGPLDFEWKPPPRSQSFLPRRGSYVPVFEIHLTGIDQWHQEPGHTFLFRTVDAQGQYAYSETQNLSFEFIESTGFVFKEQIGTAEFPHFGAHALTRSALPRRDKELRIRIQDRSRGASKPLEMVVPNPCYRTDFPVWQAETLPIEKTIGPRTVRLEKFDFRFGRLSPQFNSTSSDVDKGSPQFHHILEDATGNRGEILSPFETVWKLKTRVYRSHTAEFPESMRTVVHKLPLLAPGTVSELDRVLKFDGWEGRVLCVAGPGIVHVTGGGQYTSRQFDKPDEATSAFSDGIVNGQYFKQVSRASPFVWIDLLPELPRHTQLVVQTTQNGQRTMCPLMHISSNGRNYIVADLPALPGLSEVDLTIALSRPEEFEFLVTPPANALIELTKPEPEN